MNTAVLKDGVVIKTESGHVEAVDALNPWKRDQACGQFGQPFVCVENVAASKAGIESTWLQQTGLEYDGRLIEREYLAGDTLAGDLYDHSAYVTAHVVLGTAKALGIDLHSEPVAVVGHGGAFRFPQFGERLHQFIGTNPALFLTQEFSQNACLDGAAIAALRAVQNS
jgi:hypothetical protein